MGLLAHFHRDPFFTAWSRKSLVFHGLTPPGPTIPELGVRFPGLCREMSAQALQPDDLAKCF